MGVRFHPLPESLFDREARPFIQRLNRELRDLFALEGTIREPRDVRRSDSSVARIGERQVHVTRITPNISDVIAGASTVVGVPNLTFGTANVKGSTNTVISINSSIALFDDEQSETIGNSAAVGVEPYAARRDHTHSLGAAAFGTSSVLVGLSAINGSNLTALRSDSTLALDVSISPSWTGTHTFQSAKLIARDITGVNPMTNPFAFYSYTNDTTGPVVPKNAFDFYALGTASDELVAFYDGAVKRAWISMGGYIDSAGHRANSAANIDASFATASLPAAVVGGWVYDTDASVPKWSDGSSWVSLKTPLTSGSYTITNSTTDRTFDANSTSLNELADIVATLIADLGGT